MTDKDNAAPAFDPNNPSHKVWEAMFAQPQSWTIDSPEFSNLLSAYKASGLRGADERASLIAHINAWADERCNQLAASRAVLPVTDSQMRAKFETWAAADLAEDIDLEDDPFKRGEDGQYLHALVRNSFAPWKAAVLALATPVAGWVSVEERLPEPNVGVLVTAGGTVTAAELYGIGNRAYWSGHGFGGHEWEFHFDDSEITHWMPLPPAPVVTPQAQRAGGLCANCDSTCADGEDCPAPVVTPQAQRADGLCANCDSTCADGEDCPAPAVTPTQQEQS